MFKYFYSLQRPVETTLPWRQFPSVLISWQGPSLRFRLGGEGLCKSEVSSAAPPCPLTPGRGGGGNRRLNVVTRTNYIRELTEECLLEVKAHCWSQPRALHGLCFTAIPVYFRANCREKKMRGRGQGLTLKPSSCMKSHHLCPRWGLTEWYTHSIWAWLDIYIFEGQSLFCCHAYQRSISQQFLISYYKTPRNPKYLVL